MNKENNAIRFFSSGDQNGGVAYKKRLRKREIIELLDQQGECTIPEMAQSLNISIPTVNSLVNELIDDKLIKDYGKIDAVAGRPANLYGINEDSCFFVGVDVHSNYLHIGLLDFKKNLILVNMDIPFQLENTEESLQSLINDIKDFIEKPQIKNKNILSVCVCLGGRINSAFGYSYSYFHFNETPLSSVIEKELGIRTIIENDSRAMGYGEFHKGIVNNEKNVLFINIGLGLGLSMLINGDMYYGKSGFSGEFGHIPVFDNEIICHCGKKGCLETEVSGQAFLRNFEEAIKNGSKSNIFTSSEQPTKGLSLDDLLFAIEKEDTLAIHLLSEIGDKLGRGIALLINIFNAEMVIIGGKLAAAGDYIFLPLKSAVNKYSLSLVNNDTQICMSKLGEKAGIIGAALIARNQLIMDNEQ
jgi:predicted NBD/HSP70 family sugar kinase